MLCDPDAEQVKEGDEVTAGDVLCDVETDKATMAWENQDDGFVAKLLKEAGAKVCPDLHCLMTRVAIITMPIWLSLRFTGTSVALGERRTFLWGLQS